ncbi:Imm41 family immunity protein [Acinetobacter baumannii]|nr:Imm41 family immunity protein [Acinetobacter baumannii]HEM8710281.1 hypothetical protein [Acinetobacter baumannii]
MFKCFYQNITYCDNYDPMSFIGLWLDYGVWSDIEYWKLEKDLLAINQFYSEGLMIPNEISRGLMRIIQIMMVSDWQDFAILEEGKKYTLNDDWGHPDIFDRYERFKYILGVFYDKDVNLSNIEFGYFLRE